eukprot:scaffold48314_cov51-Phaeocystis_antarctica.AAC.1
MEWAARAALRLEQSSSRLGGPRARAAAGPCATRRSGVTRSPLITPSKGANEAATASSSPWAAAAT